MQPKARSPITATPQVNDCTTFDAYLHGIAEPVTICYCRVSSSKQRADLDRQIAHMRAIYPDAEIITDIAGGLNWKRAKDCSPYWSDCIAGISSNVVVAHRDRLARFGFELIEWLVEQNGGAVLVLNQSDASPESRTHRGIYSPFSTRSVAGCTDSGATERQSRRIRVYPNARQKAMIATWLDASRWTYNLTVEILQSGIPAVWRHIAGMVMAELKVLKPEWESVPYQVKRTSARDACRAMSNVKTFNRQLAADRARGERPDEEFAELRFRSRKNPRQSCYVPDDAVTEHGVYHTILGPLRMAEAIPAGQQECRLVKERGLYWLVVPHPAQCDIETPSGDGVVALDPGVRTFLTYFSETDCGKLGHHAFGRIQRLCHWLDDLISRTAKAPNRRKRRQMRRAQARMRQRITNLVDELHWQLARWLTSNYRIILLPTFETHDMTQRAGRRIRSKTARMMLTFRHYEFKQRLKWKAWQRGALVLDVNEAYTSKTRSWDGAVNTKLGGAKVIRDENGFGMDRDVNGARGIFLRALGDSPFLRGLLTQVASQPTATSSNVV